VAYFKAHENLVRIAGSPVDIQTGYLPNIGMKCYHYTNMCVFLIKAGDICSNDLTAIIFNRTDLEWIQITE